MNSINIEEYLNKVLGCWTGKNIGGTLGAPFEGKKEMQNLSFYAQDLSGTPAPNDDLDLQLIWLCAAERHGLYNLNEQLMGEYWMEAITGPWNEYGVCHANIRNGLYPPLSGSCNNDVWKYSNGAWIRSEIWACLFPGEPDAAIPFAYLDACADHCGDGIYAEIFTASLEAAAFVESDIRKLIETGLSKIPSDCRIARSVKLACDLYDKGSDFAKARNAIVKDSEDMGWFQAPGNIGFLVLGLLYGEGDFEKTICLAVNCGDDTDCTGATAGSILGIIKGRNGIPSKWIEPIGESIQTVAINPLGFNAPKNLQELTNRVASLAMSAQKERPSLLRINSEATNVSADHLKNMASCDFAKEKIWTRSPYELTFNLPFGHVKVEYVNGPEILSGKAKEIELSFASFILENKNVSMTWKLPPDWKIAPSQETVLNCRRYIDSRIKQTIIPGDFEGAYFYLPLEIRLAGRANHATVNVPFQKQGSVSMNHKKPSKLCECLERQMERIKHAEKHKD